METNNTENKPALAPLTASTPYAVIDSQTGTIIRRGTYANITKLRRFADRKDSEYGAVRYVVKAV